MIKDATKPDQANIFKMMFVIFVFGRYNYKIFERAPKILLAESAPSINGVSIDKSFY